ncbi:LysM peptidoglycan-binding domain-containing M23 family metallopeptidase [Microbacteriaceae bacterium K1510]|nr:LysM peptidoglycan-binding domain-containing M23 family metallopeptidase [Microbacteriaceae bacterium K1510]
MYRPAVEAQPLPAPSRPATVAASPSYSSGGGYASGSSYGSGGGYASGSAGLGTYRPSTPVPNDVTGSVQAPPPPPSGHWTWDGGRPVTVGRGETVETIARKYGVPTSAIMQTNNVSSPTALRPGQRLVIPRYVNGAVAQAPVAPQVAAVQPAPAPAPTPVAPRAAAGDHVHVVQPGESLIGLSRRYNVPLATLAKANNVQVYHKVAMGDRVIIPGAARTQAAMPRPVPVQQPAQVAAAAPMLPPPAQPVVQPPRVAAPAVAKVQTVPVETARVASEAPAPESVVKQAEATGAMPSFRWPVKGRVIAGFGQNSNGATNDGINLAVPEGTPVKAAEDGVVAYAGNELKGYGNLVLVRHSNGYVSAYANASELLVKRGDSVKRGQTIAHAGQTGNVTSPQLHFEIRKGSTPVDPTKYLGSI